MRDLSIIFCLLFLIGVAGTVKAQAQTEAQTEPYSMNLVQSALKLHAQGAYVSIVEKRLSTLGKFVEGKTHP